MRRFGTAAVLGGLLLLGASWSLSATDTPKKAPRPSRRKAVASKTASTAGNADVKLDNLYVDAEIGQVFTVNLGRADQPGSGGENVASAGSVQIYQLGSSEIEPPTSAEVAGQADPADSAAPADDETGPAAEEMQPADGPAEGDEAMEPAADDSTEQPAAEPTAPEAAPQTSNPPSQPDPGGTQQPAAPAAPAAKDAPKTPPPAASSQAAPPPPPPIR
jgi:hypothetical protein